VTGMARFETRATVGFAADERGHGLAYVRVAPSRSAADDGRLMRIPFQVKRVPSLLGSEVGYAALTAIAMRLLERGVRRVVFAVEDERLAADLWKERDVPAELAFAYVRLGCLLNQFRRHRITVSAHAALDLTVRARAEVAMHVAA